MRKALVVGIDHYLHLPPLTGCVNDAIAVRQVLERHENLERNFDVKFVVGSGPGELVEKSELRQLVDELFGVEGEVALLYFAGHGSTDDVGGFLLASDSEGPEDGLPLAHVLAKANRSKMLHRIVVLDSCNSGIAGADPSLLRESTLAEGLTVLTATTRNQPAREQDGGNGLFTGLFLDALSGAAANLLGEISPGSVYAHIDQSLGSWQQRPVFKSNVSTFVSLRKVQPPIPLAEFRRIVEFFPSPGLQFKLDPSYEPEGPNPHPEHVEIFAILRKLNRVNLVVPVGEEHMYHAAINGTACRLTRLGEHYRRLVASGRI